MVYLRGNIKFLYVLFLPVFLFTGNQSLQNKHTHLYSNEIIIHSHPLEKNNEAPVTNHNHTKAEIFFYSLVNFDYYSHSGEQLFDTSTVTTPNIYTTSREKSPYIVWLYNTGSRDPPSGKC